MEKSIGRLMSILYRKNQVYMNCALKEYDVTSAEYPCLLYLYQKKVATQDELCSFLNIDKAATARAVKSLEAKGYIARERDSMDKRFNRVYVTEKAEACKEGIRQKLRQWNSLLTEGMNEEEVDVLFHTLEKMVKKVESTDLKKKWSKE